MQTKSFRRFAFILAIPATLLFVNPSHAQGGNKGGGIKQAEAILGKPLSPAQKKAVRNAQLERQKAIKPIQARYKFKVASALGLTVAQYEQREKALRGKKQR